MHRLAELAVPKGRVAIHWFEQSSYAVKDSNGRVVQVDPYYPHHRPAERYLHPKPPLVESELPTDFVLLTHAHSDHTNPESIARICAAFPATVFIGPKESIRQIVAESGVDPSKTITVSAGDLVSLGSMKAAAVYAKPPEGDPDAHIPPPDVTHLGYVLKTDAARLYFSGDLIHTFAKIDALIEAVAALQPEVGFLTNHPTEGEFPFFDGSAEMAHRIGLKHAVPAHYACFVRRDYDPQAWAANFGEGDPTPLIIPRNTHILYPPD